MDDDAKHDDAKHKDAARMQMDEDTANGRRQSKWTTQSTKTTTQIQGSILYRKYVEGTQT